MVKYGEGKMRSKKLNEIVTNVNEFMGMAIFALGAIKAIIITMSVVQFGTTVSTLFTGTITSSYDFSKIIIILGFAEILIGGISLTMIILNINYKGGVILGYLMVIGAILMELLLPGIFFAYIECGICMKAGNIIRKKNTNENRMYI